VRVCGLPGCPGDFAAIVRVITPHFGVVVFGFGHVANLFCPYLGQFSPQSACPSAVNPTLAA
jgi:hypothetical protein